MESNNKNAAPSVCKEVVIDVEDFPPTPEKMESAHILSSDNEPVMSPTKREADTSPSFSRILDVMEPIRTNALLAICAPPDVFIVTDYPKPNPGIRWITMGQFVFPNIADPKMDDGKKHMASSNEIKCQRRCIANQCIRNTLGTIFLLCLLALLCSVFYFVMKTSSVDAALYLAAGILFIGLMISICRILRKRCKTSPKDAVVNV
ncbi:hypothetical protein CDAR_619571 [Caerostris darwini]|uniref:Uncharacterized protein n=1 Tax=Caerostris darwini TaxID=1538125 RepID=A0AAV4QV09_9ARAC|nr:hypothetical protein CDAR_619571 [Caerostris darwini]